MKRFALNLILGAVLAAAAPTRPQGLRVA